MFGRPHEKNITLTSGNIKVQLNSLIMYLQAGIDADPTNISDIKNSETPSNST
jgi:hypothetical protein